MQSTDDLAVAGLEQVEGRERGDAETQVTLGIDRQGRDDGVSAAGRLCGGVSLGGRAGAGAGPSAAFTCRPVAWTAATTAVDMVTFEPASFSAGS